MADYLENRGAPEDRSEIEALRVEAPAIEHPVSTFTYRAGPSANGLSQDLLIDFQPMVFAARRFAPGVHLNFIGSSVGEVNAFLGYQLFVKSFFVPFGRAFIGARPVVTQGSVFNVGAELGARLVLAPLAHLEIAAGSSLQTMWHVSFGVGINSLLLLLALFALH